MDTAWKAIGIRIEGIPHLANEKGEGAVFYFGADATLESARTAGWGTEQKLLEVPSDLDGSVDLQTGEINLESASFALSATEDVCKRLLTSGRSEIRPPATLTDSMTGAQTSMDVRTEDSIEVGDYLYVEDETVYVTSVIQVDATNWICGVTRAIAQEYGAPHAAGTAVYTRPPYHRWRRVDLLGWDGEHWVETPKTVWTGVIDSVTTDDQQTEVVVSASDPLSILWGQEGGDPTSVQVSGGDLLMYSSGTVRGSLEDVPYEWVNSGNIRPNFRLGDYAVSARKSYGALDNFSLILGSLADVEDRDDGSVGSEDIEDDLRQILVWSRIGADGPVGNDFEGVYGISDDEAHPAAVALALMLSTGGQGGNNLPDPDLPGSFISFDQLGGFWGMGMPAKLIDAESWIRVIDEVPVSVDRVVLGWDGGVDFKDVIINKLLRPHDLYPFKTNEGKVGLRYVDDWAIDDINDVVGDNSPAGLPTSSATVTLNPTRIRFDRRLEDYASVVKATIGGVRPGEEADKIRIVEPTGLRIDSAVGQTLTELDFSFYDKESYRRDEGDLWIHLRDVLAKRIDNPPVLHCEIPTLSAGASERLPPLLHWVRLKGGPETGIIGPDGVRIKPEDTEITFVGLLGGRTWDLESGDVRCQVLLSHWWWGDRVPRLVAPGEKIQDYNGATGWMDLSGSYPRADGGGSGFSVGDDIQIRYENGRIWELDPGGRRIDDVDDANDRVRIYPGLRAGDPSGLWVHCATVDDFANTNWAGSDGYVDANLTSRRYAYQADDEGHLGSDDQDADIFT